MTLNSLIALDSRLADHAGARKLTVGRLLQIGVCSDRQLREKQAHAAVIGDPGKDKPGAHKGRKSNEPGSDEISQYQADQNKRTGRNSHLPLQTDQ